MVVGILQVWLLFRTWRTIERQTEAAARSAAAFINKERPRLFVSAKISPDFRFQVQATNRGQSPARIVYKWVGCEILDPGETLPDIPEYKDWGGTVDDHLTNEWIVPRDSTRVGEYNAGYIVDPSNPDLNKPVMSGEYTVWFFGIVIYEDSVSGDNHSVQFCYKSHPWKDGKHWLTKDGPPAYHGEKSEGNPN